MQPAIAEFAQLVQTRAGSLEGQQACHIYVAQELIADMKDRLERNALSEPLGHICEAAFAEIEWDWQSNRSCGNVSMQATGMLLSASKIQSALSTIAARCADLRDSGSSTSLGVSSMTIDDDTVEKRWTIQQSFPCSSSSDPQESDFVSTVEFDQTGEFIAAATRLGKIGVYQKNPDPEQAAQHPYRGYCTFQSHTAEFDYLKSLEIEERINSVRWCHRESADSQLLLSTNDKTIRLWKLKAANSNNTATTGFVGATASAAPVVKAHPRRVYSNGHIYHINSLSLNSDGETFLTSDDLRINLWHLGCNHECFNIVDLKPVNMDDLSEVITAAEFHPSHCNIFIYGSSKGCIRMGDLRAAALCDQHTKNFHMTTDTEPKSFFSEIISSISDVKFSQDSNHILTRDFMTLKLWDVRQESKPVSCIPIHDHLRAKLCELYENDGIFDKFECSFSSDCKRVITGSYDHRTYVYDITGGVPTMQAMLQGHDVMQGDDLAQGFPVPSRSIDFDKKCLHTAYAPVDDTIAVAATSEVLICRHLAGDN
eukprot:TRINITY_DN8335_c0_g1_i3.p1 TRINITY_DN8335_c0_g1~~TRINITY_DN8335_c0_g1_i3.p1  ORF type:complete len:540 (-),score=152.34 TRINITY_DN8335_c0_g1_i3:219-1838(-)